MLNKIFIILALVCLISFADAVENCVYTVSQYHITFYCDYDGGNSNYELSFLKRNITYCTETIYTDSSITTIEFKSRYYTKSVVDELGATIVDSIKRVDVDAVCRELYSQLKSISTRDTSTVSTQKDIPE